MWKVAAVVLALLACAMTWQHVRYQRLRRDVAQDLQAAVHTPSRFHVLTFLVDKETGDAIEEVGMLRTALESTGEAKLVYAGVAAFTMASSQLGPGAWDAVVLVEYPSRDAYDRMAATPGYREALARFARSYSHGMQRSALVNLAIPQVLLGIRLLDVVRGHWNVGVLVPASASERSERTAELGARVTALRALNLLNDEAVVVFNLIQEGDAEQRAADRAYARQMATRFAALAHGPMHIGSAITVEGDAEFDTVAIVYYPGPSYFASLLESRFFNQIIDGKQVADTLAVPTVPILDRL